MKSMQVRFEGDKPMMFLKMIEDAESQGLQPASDPSLATILDCIKAYLRAAEDLSKHKFNEFAHSIPAHLSTPGHVLVAMCADGVVVRYDRESAEQRQMAAVVTPMTVADGARQLSQNLIKLGEPSALEAEDDSFGVELRVFLASSTSNETKDVAVGRIGFEVQLPTLEGRERNPSRPYRLASVQNGFALEVHGTSSSKETAGGRDSQFVAIAPMKLAVGWECIEIFPDTVIEEWKVESAALWAEADLLGSVVIAQNREHQLRSLDPRAEARRNYAELLAPPANMV